MRTDCRTRFKELLSEAQRILISVENSEELLAESTDERDIPILENRIMAMVEALTKAMKEMFEITDLFPQLKLDTYGRKLPVVA